MESKFDLERLQTTHARVFSNHPSYKPGELRPDMPGWAKHRTLESAPASYTVHYASNIESKLKSTLETLQDAQRWRAMSQERFGSEFAKLYADLDYLHPFWDGNSRTLRQFTERFARSVGHPVRWSDKSFGSVERDQMYVARDVEVVKRHFPGISAASIQNAGVDEYMAYMRVIKAFEHWPTLESIAKSRLQVQAVAHNPYLQGKVSALGKPDIAPIEQTAANFSRSRRMLR